MSELLSISSECQQIFRSADFLVEDAPSGSDFSFLCHSKEAGKSKIAVFVVEEGVPCPDLGRIHQLIASAEKLGMGRVHLISRSAIPTEVVAFATGNERFTYGDHAAFSAASATQHPHNTHAAVPAGVSYPSGKKSPSFVTKVVTVSAAIAVLGIVGVAAAAFLKKDPAEPKIASSSSVIPSAPLASENNAVTVQATSNEEATATSPAFTGKAKALVIGNASYAGQGHLRSPDNDANLMTETLTNLGFEVTTYFDLSNYQMDRKTKEYVATLTAGDISFFYFSGHGIRHSGENFLVPVNAQMKGGAGAPNEAFNFKPFAEMISNKRIRSSVIVLDACRANPFLIDNGENYDGFYAMPSIHNSLIAFSAAPETNAMERPGKYSSYTKNLAAALSKPPGEHEQRTLRDCFFDAGRRVKEETGQTPWVNMEAGLEEVVMWGGDIGTGETAPPSQLASSGSDIPYTDIQSAQPQKGADTLSQEIPARGFFDNDEVFMGSSYESYPAPTKSGIVKKAMRRLKQEGLLFSKETGEMSKENQEAILAYQNENQLAASGKLDEDTLTELGLTGLPAAFSVEPGDDYENKVGMAMKWVKPGTFTKRSRANPEDERAITLTEGYWLASTEVTQKQWVKIMGTTLDELAAFNQNQNSVDEAELAADRPIHHVSWEMAKEYCDKLNEMEKEVLPAGFRYDLPSDDQWVFAADGENFFQHTPDHYWNCEGTDGIIQPVATLEPTPTGFYDLVGNVAEWVRDRPQSPADEDLDDEPFFKVLRMIRGGSVKPVRYPHQDTIGHDERPMNEPVKYVGFRVAIVSDQDSEE